MQGFQHSSPCLEIWSVAEAISELNPQPAACLRRVVSAALADHLLSVGDGRHGPDEEEGEELGRHGCALDKDSTQSALEVDKQPHFIPCQMT